MFYRTGFQPRHHIECQFWGRGEAANQLMPAMAWMLVEAASPVHLTGDDQEWCCLVGHDFKQSPR